MGRRSGYTQLTALPRRQLVWFLFCRVLVVTLLLGGTIVYHYRGAADQQFLLRSLYLLAVVYYGQTAVAAVTLSLVRRRLFVQAQIVWDLLFITSLIYLTGGIDSPFHFLFYLVVIGASIFLARREIFFVASAAAILFGSLLDLQYYGFLPRLPAMALHPQVDIRQVFYAVFVNVTAIFFTALLSGILVERLLRSEQALEKSKIDYDELDNLNRTILASIGSGLMLINPLGRIRSFNTAAERISGYTLEDVYDRDVRELFPSFAVYDGTLKIVDRGEGFFDSHAAGRRTLGYASSLVMGADGNTLGLLITFKDMTWYKELEERLKRSDRLAAVGQLASGMAHEIRNPLASISGSVQLLMEGSHVSDEDRHLMRIVVKEAERLSSLLSDFLLYARPGPPKVAVTDVSSVLDELALMASADPHFTGIEIRRDYPPGVLLPLDRQQLYQAMWNLVINGAEAMPDGGVLIIGLDPANREIFVEDSGPGIPESVQNRIFNPFFTTKDHGTGLGLATVHAIVEAHGGLISVSAGRRGGARFVISLPAHSRGAVGG
jgi:two-component system sensor histidine kinase PilS (NtrC family)